MAFATASSPANREPGDNAQTAAPPQAQARPRQSPGKAEPPLRAPEPPACARAPSACQNPPAHARAPSMRRDENRAPERQPSRPSDFGMLIEPSSEFPLRRIVNFVQLRSKLTILRSLKAKTHDYLRYRKAHTRTTDKNVHFPLPRPRKTGCFDHQRPKQTVFRIAHPTRQPIPMSNKQHSRHRSR